MAKDLTTSQIERQDVLNNTVALPRIQEALEIETLEFQGVYYVTKQMAADYYGVELRTIKNCLADNEDELRHNGYRLWKGNSLKEFKLHFAPEIFFGSKNNQILLFAYNRIAIGFPFGCRTAGSTRARHIRRKWHADVTIVSRKYVKNDSYGGIIGDSMAVSMLKKVVTAALSLHF